MCKRLVWYGMDTCIIGLPIWTGNFGGKKIKKIPVFLMNVTKQTQAVSWQAVPPLPLTAGTDGAGVEFAGSTIYSLYHNSVKGPLKWLIFNY